MPLEGRREAARAALVQAPAAVGELALAQVGDDLGLPLPIDALQQVAEEQILARDGAVGLQLPYPMPVRLLRTEQEPVRALDGGVDRVAGGGRGGRGRGGGHTE